MRFTIWHSTGDPQSYIDVAIAAERAGFTSTAIHESLFYPERASARYPYSQDGTRGWQADTPFMEPLVMIAAILARTTTLRAYTFVMKFPLRHPLIVAKQAATLAALSGDRFGLGVGQSVWPEEFEYTQTDFATRRERLVEGIEVVRLATSGQMVEHDGEHYRFGRLQQAPGVSSPLPIYVGGHKPASLRIAAEFGDGWCGVPSEFAETSRCVTEVLTLLDRQHRSRDEFEIHAGVSDARTLEDFRQLQELGVTDAIVSPVHDYSTHSDPLSTSEKIRWAQRFGEEIIARV